MHTTIIAEGTDKQRLLRRLDKAWAALKRILRRFVRPSADRTWRDGRLVGEGHPRARDHVGEGGAEAPTAHHRGRPPTAVRELWRYRRLQRQDDGGEARPFALRGAEATGGHSRPPHRLCQAHIRRAIHARHALPSPPTARYVQPLPTARRGNTEKAGATPRRLTSPAWISPAGFTGAVATRPPP